MSGENAREKLLDFIDKKAFDPILKTPPDRFSGADRAKFEDIHKKTADEKKKFHEVYTTADKVKENYLDDVRSDAAQKLDKEIKHLGLPTLPQFKDEFMELCKKLGV